MFGSVTYTAAFGAGLFSFLAPCVLPMVPAYIFFISGASMESDLKSKRLQTVMKSIVFVMGFTIIFVIMGTSASVVGRLFTSYRSIFNKISGGLIIFFGLNMLGVLKINALQKITRVKQNKPMKSGNWGSALLMGMAFAAGWTPCFGPILATILVVASSQDTVMQGVTLLLAYSIGLGIPFVLTAAFTDVFTKMLTKSEKHIEWVARIGGIVLIIFGILIFTNQAAKLGYLFTG